MYQKQLVIKCGEFYYVGYDSESDEYFYSSSTFSATKFNTLEELDREVAIYNIKGYAVTTV